MRETHRPWPTASRDLAIAIFPRKKPTIKVKENETKTRPQHLTWELGVALLAFSQTFKESRFSYENEIGLLKIIRYPYQPIGEANHNGRSLITEHVDRNMLRVVLEPPPHNT